MKVNVFIALFVSAFCLLPSAFAFEGRLTAALTRGGQVTPLLYTAGTNFLRVEVTASDRPNPVDLVDLQSGEMTLLFPNNRSFVRFTPALENASETSPPFPMMPALPASPGIGPTNLPGRPALPQRPTASGMPAMPMMPPPMMEKMELTATGAQTNLLGYACAQYELKQRGETMELWATAQLFPFQPYVQNQPHRFGPRRIEEQWGGLLAEKGLFPLLAVLKFDHGAERYRFAVTAITPEKLKPEDAAKLFQPPPEYQELQPLPF
ncbi:MAG TPA: DUF4412 domain-containing protein [Verrucomicrobiae bacterium]